MKAEDRAMEHCCAKCVHDKLGCGMKIVSHGQDCIKCGNYIKGYRQVEKDLELTWEDIRAIYCITFNLKEHLGASVFGEPLYQEVLKRFKDLKHVK